MIPEKLKPALTFFVFVFATMGVMITYFLFFTTGLEILLELGQKQQTVFVTNNSVHLIRDINVFFQKKNSQPVFLTSIKELTPKERIKLELPDLEQEQVTVIAIAPFHATVKRELALERTKGAKLGFEIMTQNTAFIGSAFVSTVKVCNEAETIILVIDENHSQEFFEEKPAQKTVEIKGGECKKIEYSLTPKNTGETTIYFKATAAQTSREFEKTIRIEEG